MADQNLPVEENRNALEEPEAIDFAQSYEDISRALQYVDDTRKDFETAGPQKWISDLVDQLHQATSAIRRLEIAHVDDVVQWKDAVGDPHDVLVRLQDPKGFDEAVEKYTRANKEFELYFKKHLELLEQ